MVWFPLRVSLRKELGESFVALGLVGAALPLFESLELWDNLIVCYRLLEKKVAAEQLIHRRLEATPDDPRLWCALGDLSLEDTHYMEAWERSGKRSARAARSLARNAVRTEQFAKGAEHWESALALNPLHPEGWFNLGWCYIKVKDYSGAMRALTRAAQMDPENGEAWNNLAAVHMHKENWREAFAALTEAVKQSRGSWHTWDNYAGVAVKVEEWQTAARAVGQVVALSQGQRLNLVVLAAVVSEVERLMNATVVAVAVNGEGEKDENEKNLLPSGDGGKGEVVVVDVGTEMNGVNESFDAMRVDDGSSAVASSPQQQQQQQEEEEEGKLLVSTKSATTITTPPILSSSSSTTTTTTQFLQNKAASEDRSATTFIKMVGNLMKQIAATAAGGNAFWAQYGRYYRAMGETDAAAECLLKRVRALQGGGWRENEIDFTAYAVACEELCRMYVQFGGLRELGQAKMLLRGALKQAGERYEQHATYAVLQAVLAEVEGKQLEMQQQRQEQ